MSASIPPTPAAGITEPPNTQAPTRKRTPRFAFLQELPVLTFKPEEPNESAPLIDPATLDDVLKDMDPASVKQIKDDILFLDYELLRLFRQRDHTAKYHQNRYRKYQIGYLLLATLAALVGSMQALALAGQPQVMPVFAFFETVIALLATFLATIAGREPPMQLWLTNRRRAEELRREYFRYLLRLPPYDTLDGYELGMRLSQRAADINRGDFPDAQSS
jgi:hypothetical protein